MEPADAQAAAPNDAEDFLVALAAEAVLLAWFMLLVRDATTSGSMLATADRLDDAMLPLNVTDDDIVGMSGGLAPAPLARAALRKLKLLMPSGKILPDPIVEMLAEEGVAVR